MTLQDLERIAAAGEFETVEFKKSTAQLTRAGETLSGFLNCQGGRVFIGVTPEDRVVGQQIADSTLHDVAATLARFEPAALISQDRIRLPNDLEVLVRSAPAVAGSGPFTFAGRAYRRVGSTTPAMPQAVQPTKNPDDIRGMFGYKGRGGVARCVVFHNATLASERATSRSF